MESIIFTIENHNIIYSVNWLGIESISINGNEISKKLSLGKRVHTFDLLINGVSQTFHIESKQSFRHGNIKVILFQNNELLDTKVIELYAQISRNKHKVTSTNDSDSMFAIGMMLIVLSLCFEWSKFFLFIGLIFLFNAISIKDLQTKASESNNDLETKD